MLVEAGQIRKAIAELEEVDEKDLEFVEFFQSARGACGLDFMLRYCLIPYGADGYGNSISYACRQSGVYIRPRKMLKKLRECEKRRAVLTKGEVLWVYWYLYHSETFRCYSTKMPSLKMAITSIYKSYIYRILSRVKK